MCLRTEWDCGCQQPKLPSFAGFLGSLFEMPWGSQTSQQDPLLLYNERSHGLGIWCRSLLSFFLADETERSRLGARFRKYVWSVTQIGHHRVLFLKQGRPRWCPIWVTDQTYFLPDTYPMSPRHGVCVWDYTMLIPDTYPVPHQDRSEKQSVPASEDFSYPSHIHPSARPSHCQM